MSNQPEFAYFNKLGLRLDADFSEDLGFTLQAVANGEEDYTPRIDWAFVDYEIDNQLKVSAGKLRMPLYMLSDYKDVSYAYPWIVPPYAVYGSPDFSSFDGGKLNYRWDLGDEWSTDLEVWTGRLKNHINVGGIGGFKVDFALDNLYGLSLNLDHDWLFIRAVYMQGLATSDISELIVSQIDHSPSPESLKLRNAIDGKNDETGKLDGTEAYMLDTVPRTTGSDVVTLEDDDVKFLGLGTMLDFEHLFFNAEVTLINSDPNIIVGRAVSWYVLAGIKLPEDVSVSLTFAKDFNRPHKDAEKDYRKDFYEVVDDVIENWERDIHLRLAPNPPSDEEIAGYYNTSEFLVVKKYATLDTKSYILSSRWDFHPTASFKAEYLYKKESQFGQSVSPQAIRLAVDFVF
jgi:hypothetical protein